MTLQSKINLVNRAIKNSEYSILDSSIYEIDGLTSPRSQNFLNLISLDQNVLEIGSFCGASTVAIANTAKNVVTVDNWEDKEVISIDKKFINIINNPKEVFKHNTIGYDNINSISGDIYSEAVFKQLISNSFDIIFYDGPHELEDIYTFFMLYETLLVDTILIVDDYNFDTVKEGINIGLDSIKIKPKWLEYIVTDGESKDTFWNGLEIIIF